MTERKEEVFGALKQMLCAHRGGVYPFDGTVFDALIEGKND